MPWEILVLGLLFAIVVIGFERRASLRSSRLGSRARHVTDIYRGSFRKPSVCYLLVCEEQPDLCKVGFTRRSAWARRSELQNQHGRRLSIVYAVTMPHADVVEGRIHQRLRFSTWRVSYSYGLGMEWYRPPGGFRQLIDIINQLALEVEMEARSKNAWGKQQRRLHQDQIL